MSKDPRDRGNDRRGGPDKGRTPVPLPPSRPFRTLAFWAFVALLSLVAFRMYQGNFMTPQRMEVSYTRFIQEVDKGNIQNLQIVDNGVTGELRNEASIRVGNHDVPFKQFRTNIVGNGEDLPDRVWKANPGIEIEVRTPGFNWVNVLFSWLPLVLVLVVWLFMIRQVQSGGSTALKFGKARSRVMMETQPKVTFKDVAGADEAKQELQEIIEFLKEPQKFQRLGGRIPKGALLLGPPGSGKTLLARAVAGEAGVPFFSMSGSDFVEMFVGVGASRVRDLFEQAKRNAPCLTGDTVITLYDGRQLTIAEMYERDMIGVQVPAMTSDFGIEPANVVLITRKPCEDLYEIVTASGSVRATGNHQFPVLREGRLAWVRVDELDATDRIAAPRILPTPGIAPRTIEFMPDEAAVHLEDARVGVRHPRLGELRGRWTPVAHQVRGFSIGQGGFASSYLERVPTELPEDVLYLCGLIESDGHWGSPGDRSISFVNTEPALHERIREIAELHFDYSPRRYENRKHFEAMLPQGRRPQSLRDSWTTTLNNRLLCDTLRSVQQHVLELPMPLIAAWLRGVFDGDGSVRFDASSPQVILSSWSSSGNGLIRDALLRIGIPTSVSPAAAGGLDGNIVITGSEAVRRFRRLVASDHPVKDAVLGDLVGAIAGRETSSSRLDAVPVGLALREARESVGMGQRSFRSGHQVSTWERGQVTPSRGSLRAAVEEIDAWCAAHGIQPGTEVAHVRDLVEGAVFWTPIRSIRPVQAVDWVYDLCLDRHHNFVANRMFTHNCIVFVDEIDAVGRHRGAGLGGGHDEREQTLNQLLVEMDGFESNEGVIMIAATNRPDVLDPALLRPGRFDRQIVVDWPDVRGREGILKVHTKKIPLAEDVDLGLIARGTPGMAGADLANMVNEAALLAARRNHKKVTMRDIEDAKDKVMLGMERKSLVMNEGERRTTAYHEAGHALVAWLTPGSDPVTKVTIIPRGRALGITAYTPQEERHNYSKSQLEDRLVWALGGRAAELVIFGHLTTGAANDLEQVTNISRSMVTRFGMSDKLGPLTFGRKEEMVFLGREIATHKDYSEQTAETIDEEVRRIVEIAHQQAMKLLKENLDKLHLLANTLLERETLDGEELNRVLRGETLEPMRRDEPPPSEPEKPAEDVAARAQEGAQLDAFQPPPAPKPAGA